MGATECKCRTCAEDGEIKGIEPIKFPHADKSLEDHLLQLFTLHDLNKNGVLEELELVQLNKKIALLHYGADVDTEAVKTKYQKLFRSKLDQNGEPVSYFVFRKYMLDVLGHMDADIVSQTMILEHFIAEANLARAAFHVPRMQSDSDAPFLGMISFDEGFPIGAFAADTLQRHSSEQDACCSSQTAFPVVCGEQTCRSFGYSSTSLHTTDDPSSEHYAASPASTSVGDSDSEVIPGSPTLSVSVDSEVAALEPTSASPCEISSRIGPWL